jgi:capsular polysaccharide biosynthesis protein
MIPIDNYLKKKKIKRNTLFKAGRYKNIKYDEIYSTELNDIFILAKSNILYDSDKLLVNRNYDKKIHKLSELSGDFRFLKESRQMFAVNNVFKIKYLESAAACCHPVSHNYAHFLLEVLPKAFLYDKIIPKSVPLVFDLPAHQSIQDAIDFFISKKRNKIYIKKNVGFYVKKLCFISDISYFPWHYLIGNKIAIKFNPYPFILMRARFQKKKNNFSKKIFLIRTAVMRKLVNQNDIISKLYKLKYLSHSIGKLKFLEQVDLIRHAKTLIGTAGSDLANCIFAPIGTNVIILSSNEPYRISCFWKKLFSPLGLNVYQLTGECVGSNGFIDEGRLIHRDFKISQKRLIKLLASVSQKKN